MTKTESTPGSVTLVAVDVAKGHNEVLIEPPLPARRRHFRVANRLADYERMAEYLRGLGPRTVVGFEATGNYHRPLAHFLHRQGFELRLIPTLALARTREAMHNSWDKNDPKDAQVILHLLKTGLTQTWHAPLVSGTHDAQELSKTHHQVALARTRVWHSLRNHCLQLYFPAIEHFIRSDSNDWLIRLRLQFPTPGAITALLCEEFVAQGSKLVGRQVHKTALRANIYAAAQSSIALPVASDSPAIARYRRVLEEYLARGRLRESIAAQAATALANHPDRRRLMTVPGVGPITALTILAEAGELRRFAHYRQFLKFCGMNLSTQQSGRCRSVSRLSKYGNARLRTAFWMAAQSAVRMRENSLRRKFDRYVHSNPLDAGLRRKAYSAVAAKLARIVYGLIKHGTDYRPFFEDAIPGG
jgi:transposase